MSLLWKTVREDDRFTVTTYERHRVTGATRNLTKTLTPLRSIARATSSPSVLFMTPF